MPQTRMQSRKLLTFIFSMLAASSAVAAEDANKPIGFYQGAVIFSVTWGQSLGTGGTLVDHEKEVQRDLQVKNTQGLLELRAGPYVLPQGSVQPVSIDAGPAVTGIVEYGVFDHIGMGFVFQTGRVDSVRQTEKLFFLPTGAGQPSRTDIFISAIPEKAALVSSRSALFQLSFHPFAKSNFDFWIAGRAGFVDTRSVYRSLPAVPTSPFARTEERGQGSAVGCALGINIPLNEDFGFTGEISAVRNTLRGSSYSGETLFATFATAGFFFNFDNLRKY